MTTIKHFAPALTVALCLTACTTDTSPPAQKAYPGIYRKIESAEKAGRTVMYPVTLHSVKPKYPAQPASGSVSAVMLVQPDGRVSEVKIIGEAPEAYVQSIEIALRQWQFRPGTVDGRAETFAMAAKMTFRQSAAAKAKPQGRISVDTQAALVATAYPALCAKISAHKLQGDRVELPPLVRKEQPRHPSPPADGTTWMAFIVNEAGRVENVQFFGRTPLLFREAIQEALAQWEFQPAKVNGKPHPFPVAIQQTFKTNTIFMLKP